MHSLDSGMDPVDGGAADEVVLVFGPVGALEQVVDRLTARGVRADPAPVPPDARRPLDFRPVMSHMTASFCSAPARPALIAATSPGHPWFLAKSPMLARLLV